MPSSATGSRRPAGAALAALLVASAPLPVRADDATGPVYRVDPAIDLPVTLIAGTIALSWTRKGELEPVHCAPVCDDEPLLFVDRPVAGFWHPEWARAGNIFLPAMIASAAGAVALHEDSVSSAASDLLLLTQALALGSGLHALAATATRRPRPLMYGTEAPEDVRLDPEHGLSFYSGHVGAAFATTLFTYSTLDELAPDSWVPELALGVGLGGSLVVSVARVRSGLHFPTDALAGAAIGTSLGLLIPALHRRSDPSFALGPSAGPVRGLTLSGHF